MKQLFYPFQTSLLSESQNFILMVQPKSDSATSSKMLEKYILENKAQLSEAFLKYGGVVFKGFKFSKEQFSGLLTGVFSQSVARNYKGGGAERVKIDEGLYLATVAPKKQILPLHQELSHSIRSPSHICFFCETPPTMGGETPLFSSRTMMKEMDKEMTAQIRDRKVLYRWNFTAKAMPGHTSGWERTFETTDKREVERFCQSSGAQVHWEGDMLALGKVLPGVRRHPITGEEVQFHQIYYQTRSTSEKGLTPHIERMMGPGFSPEELEKMRQLPAKDHVMNCYFGDGAFIDQAILSEMDRIHLDYQVKFPWAQGDFMLLDNYLTWHGRNAYEGDGRKILTMFMFQDSAAQKIAV